jgi:hypothetical protein
MLQGLKFSFVACELTGRFSTLCISWNGSRFFVSPWPSTTKEQLLPHPGHGVSADAGKCANACLKPPQCEQRNAMYTQGMRTDSEKHGELSPTPGWLLYCSEGAEKLDGPCSPGWWELESSSDPRGILVSTFSAECVFSELGCVVIDLLRQISLQEFLRACLTTGWLVYRAQDRSMPIMAAGESVLHNCNHKPMVSFTPDICAAGSRALHGGH